MILSLVSKRYPNNTNLNNTNTTTTKGGEDAVAVVNFKKIKEKGKEKMRAPYNSKEHYTGQAIKERMVELDFKKEFIEKKLIRLWVLQYYFSSSPSIFLIALLTVV